MRFDIDQPAGPGDVEWSGGASFNSKPKSRATPTNLPRASNAALRVDTFEIADQQ